MTADGSLDFVEVGRHQTKRDRKSDGTWAFYARHTLTCRSSDAVHDWWEPLTPTQTDEAHKFNRSDYLRVLSPTDPDYPRVYGMRADTESLNAQFERAFYNRRLPAPLDFPTSTAPGSAVRASPLCAAKSLPYTPNGAKAAPNLAL